MIRDGERTGRADADAFTMLFCRGGFELQEMYENLRGDMRSKTNRKSRKMKDNEYSKEELLARFCLEFSTGK